jgi:hypothetical protein
MKGVDTIARVRREYFVRGRTIMQILRDLHVSRNTVRKILRSDETAFEFARSVQPQPKIGAWREELDRILARNAGRPRRERLTLMRIFEVEGLPATGSREAPTERPRLCGRLRRGSALRRGLGAAAGRGDGGGLRAAELRAGRGLPVRLEP